MISGDVHISYDMLLSILGARIGPPDGKRALDLKTAADPGDAIPQISVSGSESRSEILPVLDLEASAFLMSHSHVCIDQDRELTNQQRTGNCCDHDA